MLGASTYSFRELSWRKVGECPALQFAACQNIYGRMILAVGEPNASDGVTSAVQLFNPADPPWTELPRLPHAVRSATPFVSGAACTSSAELAMKTPTKSKAQNMMKTSMSARLHRCLLYRSLIWAPMPGRSALQCLRR